MVPGNDFYRKVGQIIRARRKQARLTQDELAASVGLTRTSIANIEAGRQQLLMHVLVAISNTLNTPVNLLVPGSQLEAVGENSLAGIPLDSLPMETVTFLKKGLAVEAG